MDNIKSNEFYEQWVAVKEKNDKILSEISDAKWDEPHALIESSFEDDYFKNREGTL